MGQGGPNRHDQHSPEGIPERKRGRDGELEHESVPANLSRVDSMEWDDSVVCSPEAKLIQEDLLSSILDGPDETAIQGLDSVMRSFEEEMLVRAPALAPELGFLLEASDDKLGLPPTLSSGDGATGITDLEAAARFGFGEELRNYDSFEFGLIGESVFNGGDEFLALGGLFYHSDDSLGMAADAPLSAW